MEASTTKICDNCCKASNELFPFNVSRFCEDCLDTYYDYVDYTTEEENYRNSE